MAALAGVPEHVVKRARRRLQQLEQQARQAGDPPAQSDLFGNVSAAPHSAPAAISQQCTDSANSQLMQALNELDIDDLSPRQALDELYRLQQLLQQDE